VVQWWFSGSQRWRSRFFSVGRGQDHRPHSQSPAIKTCVVETITVKGTGKCSDVRVFFGDGNRLITLGKPRPFPQTFPHVYATGGFTRVSAEAYTGPGSTCTGKASVTVQVAAGPKPTITSMFALGFFSHSTPRRAV